MKKRVKIIFSFISITIALALMSFGVIAATSVSVSINCSVSYSVGDNITFFISGVRTVGGVADAYYNKTNSQGGEPHHIYISSEESSLPNWDISNKIELSYQNPTIVWTFTITRPLQENNIKVTIGDFNVGASSGWVLNTNCSFEKSGTSGVTSILTDDVPTDVSATFTVTDLTTSITNNSNISSSFTMDISKL